MTLNGIPLHPLIVHGAVVFVPLTLVFAALLFLRRIRRTMTYMAGAAGVLGFIFVAVAHNTGEQLQEALPSNRAIIQHAELATTIMPLTFAVGFLLTVLAILELPAPVAVVKVRTRIQSYRVVLPLVRVVALLLAVVSVVQIVLLGDSGAAAVWFNVVR
ncbi:hypothetical protein IV498_02010 [Paenarthrobacter sp. Z7-10]|uniref:DUF2231 domain-containing protein n=1 Tax=Paenarthrobacter sp. Z7-10 TaxID=2787635 RepID=UPI0022A9313F|nr:DUF2231 domain-containing protein [Paenarthrobacter sp. Z7-10]MCZ2401990.1 hypothetical protein [Paenarthrobacter sp. Z7-10]